MLNWSPSRPPFSWQLAVSSGVPVLWSNFLFRSLLIMIYISRESRPSNTPEAILRPANWQIIQIRLSSPASRLYGFSSFKSSLHATQFDSPGLSPNEETGLPTGGHPNQSWSTVSSKSWNLSWFASRMEHNPNELPSSAEFWCRWYGPNGQSASG